ncbi:peptidase C1-like family [Lactobacillus paragasseri JV-V03]|uniref:Aminopeptidase n=2 Tax=Lactobacillus paragasseri TaxID=2107999 RepID=A0AA86ZWS4_9LACO|nr:peptidase C1-like family [Lactobacillus paragasseri JV-V03]
MKNGIKKSITNQSVINSQPFVFSVDVDSNKVMNQKQSGRCWDFSGLNFIRYHVEKEHHIKDMELSGTYVYFYDKLEKANYFYQNIINTADRPLSDRLVNWLLTTPQQDGGDWQLLVDLIEKYGIVPFEAMPEDAVSANSQELNRMFNRKLQKDALKLRDLANSDASDEKMKSVLHHLNAENYRVLAISLGTPPEKFTYEYRDENNEYHTTGQVTPMEFFKKFVNINFDDYVELMNLPGENYPYNTPFGVEISGNMVGGQPSRYFNVSMKDMEKTKRFEYRESLPTHAMLISGVDMRDDKPIRWKIQNSWGNKPGHKGYFIMGNDWMEQYTYETVVNKKYLTDEQLAAYEKEPVMLPYWNAMNPI